MVDGSRKKNILEPIYDKNCKVLILGSMPGEQSLKAGQYYAAKRNRFWDVIAHVCNENVPEDYEEKKNLVLRNHIALYDVLKACNREGSLDSKIVDPEYTDIKKLIEGNEHIKIFCNGKKAHKLFEKHYKEKGLSATYLQSTSAANAKKSPKDLEKEWAQILQPRLGLANNTDNE